VPHWRLRPDLGVNLAGVEAILHLRARLEPMQATMASELGRMREQYENETRRLKQIIERLQR